MEISFADWGYGPDAENDEREYKLSVDAAAERGDEPTTPVVVDIREEDIPF